MKKIKTDFTPYRTRTIIGILLLFAFAISCHYEYDYDVWMHLAAGKYIVEHKNLPWVDEFSFTSFGEEIVQQEWLSQLLFYGVYKLGGINTLIKEGLAEPFLLNN